MLIAIDYDETFTEDPDFWRDVIALGATRGHRFICVTGRSTPPDPTREPPIPCLVLCSPQELKDHCARRNGFHVNVWIDDMPGLIKGSQTLIWNDDERPKDHEIREAVNQLRDVAQTYHATQQLRGRISAIVCGLFKTGPQ